MRRAAVLLVLLSSCVEAELRVPDDPIDVGEGDGVINSPPYVAAVRACDDTFSARDASGQAYADYWTCLLSSSASATLASTASTKRSRTP